MTTSANPNVCFLAGTLSTGGAERQLVYMLRALTGARVNCRLLCLTSGEPLEEEIRGLGIAVEFLGEASFPAARLTAIVRSLRRQPADILQSAHFYTNIYAGLAARATGATSIGAIRNDVLLELRRNRPFGRAHLLLPHFLLANSRIGQERARRLRRSAGRVLLLENAIDVSRFAAPLSRDVPAQQIRLLSAGRLVRQKRVDRFLRLVAGLVDRLQQLQVEAVIAGEGPLRGELEEMASRLKISQHTRFLGEVADMRGLYQGADLLVLTSDHEGTPNVVLEAMASELPVVATGVGGLPDLMGGGGGMLVEPGNERELLEAALELALDPSRRRELGAQGRRQLTDTRSLPVLQRRLSAIYRTALETRMR